MLLVLLAQLSTGGCAVVAIGVAGAGAGFGTYTYLEGELRRMYQAGHEESIQAVMSSLPELAMSVKDNMFMISASKPSLPRNAETDCRL
ncbi:MAG: DUF3568 family protein [Desulfobacteraceae bacterium]|nr:DUF3568 family protein [Desulfobacteraceae bacterium]